MVAVAQLMPADPEEQRTVRGVLRELPELPGFIARATERAQKTFTDPEIHLDTVRYDEWDPPLRLIIRVPMSWSTFEPAFDAYLKWLSPNPQYDRGLILGFPSIGDRSTRSHDAGTGSPGCRGCDRPSTRRGIRPNINGEMLLGRISSSAPVLRAIPWLCSHTIEP